MEENFHKILKIILKMNITFTYKIYFDKHFKFVLLINMINIEKRKTQNNFKITMTLYFSVYINIYIT